MMKEPHGMIDNGAQIFEELGARWQHEYLGTLRGQIYGLAAYRLQASKRGGRRCHSHESHYSVYCGWIVQAEYLSIHVTG